jgi:hypothetical protein
MPTSSNTSIARSLATFLAWFPPRDARSGTGVSRPPGRDELLGEGDAPPRQPPAGVDARVFAVYRRLIDTGW